MVRAPAAAARSAASAAKAASSGSVPTGLAPNHATVCGMLAAKTGLCTERCSICPMGMTKLTSTKASSGSTSRKARRRARACARASAVLSGVPSAAVMTLGLVSAGIWAMRALRGQGGGAGPPPAWRQLAASQALKRSLSSMSWSAQNSMSVVSASAM